MSVKTLTENLKSGNFQSLYYIYGAEEYLKEHYYNQLKSKCCTEFTDFNIVEFLQGAFDFNDFCNCVNSFPVMADRKFVGVIDMPNNLSDDFCEFLKQIPDFCTVVFFDSEQKVVATKNNLETAVLNAGGVAVKVEKPTPSALASWVARHLKTYSKTMSPSDIDYLLSIADTDMRFLSSEISKLCNFAKNDVITKEDIDLVVTKSIEANRFALGDAFYAGDYAKVLDILDKMYKQNVENIIIANVFYKAFTDLYSAKLAIIKNKTPNDFAKDFVLNTYVANKLMRNARGLSYEFLKQCIKTSKKLDIALKSASKNQRELITMYVAELVDWRQKIGKA